MRVRTWSPLGSMKTCVFPFSRRNGFEWTMRSRSRWNGVRTPHASSSRARPRVSYERTANGEQPLFERADPLLEGLRHAVSVEAIRRLDRRRPRADRIRR